MRDIRNPAVIWTKAILLLAIGIITLALLLLERGTWTDALLLVVCIWGFCRAYYFAFYVIEKYVDPGYRFSGLISFVRYLVHRRRK